MNGPAIRIFRIASLATCLCVRAAIGADIVVELAPTAAVLKAEATTGTDSAIRGTIDLNIVRFKGVLTDTAYDVAITLPDGAILQGVNLGWYSLETTKPDAGELDDDDKQQINAILKDVPSFYNRNNMLLLAGDHDRATALVELVRDKAFHSDAGGEVIWHIELWYFKNQHGGWEKVQQQNKIIRRERFADKTAYHDVADCIKWTPELGGVKVPKGQDVLTVKLEGKSQK